ncbi:MULTISPECIES: acyl carrier protein [Streptomyces]|uniref:Acyl carrier protein n=1 Tax=Streptomyces murinus TaxID=33900 RepID=A0A7W3RPY9_STRMR|nr:MULTISPECIES: acyl carrier protein [Streptomyces]MYU02763.1 acyl carrier protein [Streptomyces sp. SID8366]MYU67760.1 acyl carrier protein [Streptomyces sp. SID69]NDK25432.1 acyl carrier protein [Streptomyces sp. TR1341]MBA9057736.1 acyl carrier protein [Streptomyces murinus]RAJ55669.1 phosphopantetheine binding protein [Streptomyces sp. PsTaAH-130]
MTPNAATAAPVATPAVTVDLLVDIFRDVLRLPDLTAETDFYEAGGDSLTAFQITGRLQEILGADVPVSLVFAYPTPLELAEVVEADYGTV